MQKYQKDRKIRGCIKTRHIQNLKQLRIENNEYIEIIDYQLPTYVELKEECQNP